MIQAGYRSICACGNEIDEGDPIGKVDGEWCCLDCVEAMGEDEWPPREREEPADAA